MACSHLSFANDAILFSDGYQTLHQLSPRLVEIERISQSIGTATPKRKNEKISLKIEQTNQPHIKIVYARTMTPPEQRARNPILGYYIQSRVEVNCQTMTARTVSAISHLEDRKPYASCPINPNEKHMTIPYFNSESEIKPRKQLGMLYSNALLNVCGTMDDVKHLLPQPSQKKKWSDWLKF